jgi:transposase-like protein
VVPEEGPCDEVGFTEEQILAILHGAERGRQVDEICRQHGIGKFTYYRWKAKYGALQLDEAGGGGTWRTRIAG